ncbi:MAG: hypothetical protein U0840_28985 [Gemmataceae bacterium]
MRYSLVYLWLCYVNREPRIAGLALGLLLALMLSPFSIITAYHLPLILDGAVVEAQVITRFQARENSTIHVAAMGPVFAHGGRKPSYRVRYEFRDAGGTLYQGEGRLPGALWQSLQPGDPVLVRYLRPSPSRNQPEATFWEFWPAILGALVGLTVLAYSVRQGLAGFHWVNQQVRLVRGGSALPGKICRAEEERRGRRGREVVCVLEYEYAIPEIQRGQLEMRGRMLSHWKTGAAIVILVDHLDPTVHALDIFRARQMDHEELFRAGSPETLIRG